jgi:hypothetical protein
MARQDSNNELAGQLAASLTPRVGAALAPPRGAQNSGLFDVGALYAEAFAQVALRARAQAQRLPLARATQPTWPRARERREPEWGTHRGHLDRAIEVPIDFETSVEAPRSRGLGWFGVAVAWLATVTTGAWIATTLPAHAPTRVRPSAAALVVSAPVVVSAPFVATNPAQAPAGEPLRIGASAPGAPVVAFAPGAPVVAAVAPIAEAPGASPVSVLSPRKLAPRAAASPHAHSPAAASGPVSSTPQASARASAPSAAPSPKAQAAPAAKPTAAAQPGAAMSLEDLMRHEVQAESKHH